MRAGVRMDSGWRPEGALVALGGTGHPRHSPHDGMIGERIGEAKRPGPLYNDVTSALLPSNRAKYFGALDANCLFKTWSGILYVDSVEDMIPRVRTNYLARLLDDLAVLADELRAEATTDCGPDHDRHRRNRWRVWARTRTEVEEHTGGGRLQGWIRNLCAEGLEPNRGPTRVTHHPAPRVGPY